MANSVAAARSSSSCAHTVAKDNHNQQQQEQQERDVAVPLSNSTGKPLLSLLLLLCLVHRLHARQQPPPSPHPPGMCDPPPPNTHPHSRTCSELTSSSCGSTGDRSASSVWVALAAQHITAQHRQTDKLHPISFPRAPLLLLRPIMSLYPACQQVSKQSQESTSKSSRHIAACASIFQSVCGHQCLTCF